MKSLFAILIISVFVCLLNSCESAKPDAQAAAGTAPTKDSLIKRGAYLVAFGGCNDCHSPKNMGPKGPEIDTTRVLSGFPSDRPIPVAAAGDSKNGLIVFNGDLTAYIGPWGTSFAANITSDATGVGNWSLGQFKNAVLHGKYMGLDEERMIVPPMPLQDFKNLTDNDIEAIFTYLKSTKPVKNVVPSYRPPVKS